MTSVILTRSTDDNARSARVFEQHGFRVHSVPMIELQPLPIAPDYLDTVRGLAPDSHLLLTSTHATKLWLTLLHGQPDAGVPLGYYIVGATSCNLLRNAYPDAIVCRVAESATALLQANFDGVKQLMYPCSSQRQDMLVEGLTARHITVIELPLYTPIRPAHSHEILHQVLRLAEHPPVICFFSPSAVESFFSLPTDVPAASIFAAIGTTTLKALHQYGIDDVVCPKVPTLEALAEALKKVVSGQ